MPVIECRVEVAPSAVDALQETVASLLGTSWTIHDERLSGHAWLAGYFSSRAGALRAWRRLASTLAREWVVAAPVVRLLADADWRDSYRRHFRAWHLGRIHWVPQWERKSYRLPPGDAVVWLDPGMAFGTGNHETTRLCCERLVEFAAKCGAIAPRAAAGPSRDAKWTTRRRMRSVIDVGSGSGILAISAVRLGLGPVVGFDDDPEAVRVSRANAALNGVTDQIEFSLGDIATGLGGRPVGLVLANIQADVLMRCARELTGRIAHGGWLVLGGILTTELPQVRTKFASVAGAWATDSHVLGDWADLVLMRPPGVRGRRRGVQNRSVGVRLRNSSR